jgi:excisionase family DNA binding protein
MSEKAKLTVPEAARKLGYSLKWVYDLVYAGRIPATKTDGRWRISADAVAERLKRKEQQQ